MTQLCALWDPILEPEKRASVEPENAMGNDDDDDEISEENEREREREK